MRLRSALGTALVALAIGSQGQAHAARPVRHASGPRPTLSITSATVSRTCITVRVAVRNFKLVKPDFAHPGKLKGNVGYIRYHLSGSLKLNALREITNSTSFRWCGAKDGVKRGENIVQIYLITSGETLFPGTMPLIRIVRVR